MADTEVDLSLLPPIGDSQSDDASAATAPDNSPQVDLSVLPPISPEPPDTQALLASRTPHLQTIADGSATTADADAKARAADAAQQLADIDRQLGEAHASPSDAPTPLASQVLATTPHARLMASDRYRHVYDSALPILGEDAAQKYARETIAKQAHDVPYLRDSILADIMALPKGTALDSQYGVASGSATPAPDTSSFMDYTPAGALIKAGGGDTLTQIAGANVGAGVHEIASDAVKLTAGTLGIGADKLMGLFGHDTTAVEDFAFKNLVDPFEHNIEVLKAGKPEAHSTLEKTVDKATAMVAPLALAVATKNPEALGIEGAQLFGASNAAKAWDAVTASLRANLQTATTIAAPGAVEAGERIAEQGGSPLDVGIATAGEQSRGTAQNILPIAAGRTFGQKAISGAGVQAALGAAGRAGAGEAGDASDVLSDIAVGGAMGQMHSEGPAATVHPDTQARIDYVNAQNKGKMWSAAELRNIDKTGQTRDEGAFQSWQAAQATPAETATPEAAATMQAAEELVGAPSAAERDARFRELASNSQRTPEEHEELANLAQQHVEQARVANSNEPIEGLQNENARQRMLADGELGEHVMKLDLDDFKNTNDTHSYATGNDAIKNAGERLAQNAPEGVHVFHQSGDEFIAHSDDPAKLAQLRDTTNDQLAKDKLQAQNKAGEVTGEIDHPVFSGGIGHDESSAEAALKNEKQRKLDSGERLGRREADIAPAITETGRTDGPENAQADGEAARQSTVGRDAEVAAPAGSAEADASEAQAPADAGTAPADSGDRGELVEPANPVDEAAHTAATSPLNDKAPPTPAQARAGNYSKGHVRLQGLDISIENPRGSTRNGVDENGKPWTREMRHHYGYIRATLGADGQHIDTMLGEAPGNPTRPVFVINQKNAKGGFDEHKVMLGFKNQRDAERAYKSEYPRGWDRMGEVRQMSSPDFKEWLKTGAPKEVEAAKVAREGVGIRNEDTAARREARGAEPVEKNRARTVAEYESDARQALAENPNHGEELAAEVSKTPRQLSGTEGAILAMHSARIEHEHAAATEAANAAREAGDAAGEASALARMKIAEDSADRNEKAATHAGTEWHEAGMARQLIAAKDLSLTRMIAKAKVAAGRDLRPEERAQLEKAAKIIAEADKHISPTAEPKAKKNVGTMVEKAALAEFDKLAAKLKAIPKDKQMTEACAL